MPYVFLSYSRQDRIFAETLVRDLRDRGIEVWRDVDSILPGDDWQKKIVQGIMSADAILVLLSQHFVRSTWVIEELNYALANKVRVIPLLIDEQLDTNQIPPSLSVFQWLDFRLDYDVALETLIHAFVPESTKQDYPIEHNPPQTKGYVFISYAEEDTRFVLDLKEFLKKRGYAYWDYQESERNYHDLLGDELEDAIREATATVSILSPDWKRSRWTQKEYLFSEDIGTPVFLLRVREYEPILVIAGIPYIDFVKDSYKGFEELDRELKRKGLL